MSTGPETLIVRDVQWQVTPRRTVRPAALGEKLVYITQPNLGGAGGFTRGLYEVAGVAGADHANVIFMDDDVICESDVLIRLNAFANRIVEPVIVGAQMLQGRPPQVSGRRRHVDETGVVAWAPA